MQASYGKTISDPTGQSMGWIAGDAVVLLAYFTMNQMGKYDTLFRFDRSKENVYYVYTHIILGFHKWINLICLIYRVVPAAICA
jgi:hypothetical protein